MKAAFESLHTGNHSFLIRQFEEKGFTAPYHFHPEFELTFIVNGTGKRYVGTHMQDYFPGDLVLLGSNLPHCWKSESIKKSNAVSVVVQFIENFMGDDFFAKPEMESIQQLLGRSSCGIHFNGNTESGKSYNAAGIEREESF